ncbi:GTPase IMAP family member 4 [Labeo rohita]|uniref:GTPase IMAP family member 4 n=1 Tax=Labeo rohita TaxID=84645 RepID=A0ABQ8LHX7_LABRO|nr:GTPase IMAP family member 4 [Labeo rohita]
MVGIQEYTRVQVKNLLKTIDKMVKENGCYTNDLFQEVNKFIYEEMINLSEDGLFSEEKQERAKKVVYKKLLIRLAGVSTGTLIGSFLGIGVAVASVVALLKAVSAGAGTVDAAGVAGGVAIATGVALGNAALAGAIGGGIPG